MCQLYLKKIFLNGGALRQIRLGEVPQKQLCSCAVSAVCHQLLSLSRWGRVSVDGLGGSLSLGLWRLHQEGEESCQQGSWQEAEGYLARVAPAGPALALVFPGQGDNA